MLPNVLDSMIKASYRTVQHVQGLASDVQDALKTDTGSTDTVSIKVTSMLHV